MIDDDLAPQVHASLRAMKDASTPPPRCHNGPIRSVEDEWRLVRFADGPDITLRPERTRRVDLAVASEDLGQGETKTVYRYQWTDGGRSILAEEVKTEIFDGATPYSTYVRGVIIDGDGGALLTGRGDSALVIEG